ncbi:MAG: DUF4143 domain-containing protein, partial [Blautia wexlerae]
LGKYYIVDIGLRNYLLGFRDRDSGHAIENVVYFELLRRGYDVSIGKIDNLEVDFIATKADDKLYVQVTESMTSEDVRKRELTPLQKRACEKTRVFSFVLLLIVIIIAILHKKGYSSPYPIRMIL